MGLNASSHKQILLFIYSKYWRWTDIENFQAVQNHNLRGGGSYVRTFLENVQLVSIVCAWVGDEF